MVASFKVTNIEFWHTLKAKGKGYHARAKHETFNKWQAAIV